MNYEGKWNGKLIRSPRLKKKNIDNTKTPNETSDGVPEKSCPQHLNNSEVQSSKLKIVESHSTILESISLTFEFKINRMPDEDFGFRVALKEDSNWFIESITPNSPIDRIGHGQCLKIKPGDRLISINSYPLSALNNPNFLNELQLLIRLRVQRNHGMEDNFLKQNNIKPHRIIIEKNYFKTLTTKFEVSETPIKNYIKVGKFIFESFSSAKLISKDIIIKINNVDIFGTTVKEIINLINHFDDYIVLYILRENSGDIVNNNHITKNNTFSHKTLPTPIQSNLIIPSIQIDDEPIEVKENCANKLESSSKSKKTWYPQQGIVVTKPKTSIGSIRRIRSKIRPRFSRNRKTKQKRSKISIKTSESKGTMTEHEYGSEENSNVTDTHKNSHYAKSCTEVNVSKNTYLEETKPKEFVLKTTFKKSATFSRCPIKSARLLVDDILKNYSLLNIYWDNFEKRNLFWNNVISAFIGKFGLGICCEIYKGFPIVSNFYKIGVASISRNIKLGDLVISLNDTILVNKLESEVNSLIKSVPQGLVKLRILRNMNQTDESFRMFTTNSNNIPRNILENNSIDLTKGAVLKLEIEKTNVIGFFIDGGSGQPIFIKKMYSGSSGSKMGILLRPGDIIISVDRKDFQNISHGDGFQILQELKPGKYQMEIFRKF